MDGRDEIISERFNHIGESGQQGSIRILQRLGFPYDLLKKNGRSGVRKKPEAKKQRG